MTIFDLKPSRERLTNSHIQFLTDVFQSAENNNITCKELQDLWTHIQFEIEKEQGNLNVRSVKFG